MADNRCRVRRNGRQRLGHDFAQHIALAAGRLAWSWVRFVYAAGFEKVQCPEEILRASGSEGLGHSFGRHVNSKAEVQKPTKSVTIYETP
jgi:hypothetical protein